jgi:hypothetical protein
MWYSDIRLPGGHVGYVDGQRHSQHVGKHRFNEIPLDLSAKQRIDVDIATLARRVAQIEFFPVANSRHQLDPQQICQTKDGGALTLGVGVDGIGTYIGFVLLDEIQDLMSLPGAAGREA